MTTAQHTPGPWFAVEAESMKYCSVVEFEYGSGARGTVGLVGSDGVTIGASSLDEQNANARAITALPDLLTALEAFRAEQTAMARAMTLPPVGAA